MPPQLVLTVTLGTGLLWIYFMIVTMLGHTIFEIYIRVIHLIPMMAASLVGIYWIVRLMCRSQLISPTRMKGLTVLSIALLFSLVTSDIGYSIYLNVSNSNEVEDSFSYSLIDRQLWTVESIPLRYFPTEKNFRIHKPNVTIKSVVYGDLYRPRLMASPTIVNSILESRQVSSHIDKQGFRKTIPLKQARIFALGDSYTFGVSVTQDKIWVEQLQRMLEEPIYNLGVSGHSPKQQLMLLEYLLKVNTTSLNIRHLLWQISESNDLEESYEVLSSVHLPDQYSLSNIFRGTLVDLLRSIPPRIQEQSIIHRLIAGRVGLGLPRRVNGDKDPYMVDGTRLTVPLYHSTQYGYRLFYPPYIERAGESESYVSSHPNRRLFDETFRDMASLGKKYGFKITVLVAPSAPRLYGQYFENFPPISEEPYFIKYVEKLAHYVAFDVINLYSMMQPYAKKELLYWHDDTHWNERGHQVVAEIVAKHYAGTQTGFDSTNSRMFTTRRLP